MFEDVREAKALAASWRHEYNHHRPHSSLGYVPPAVFAARLRSPEPPSVGDAPRCAAGRAFYSDHLGLLNAIDKGAEALLEAQAMAAWNFITYKGKLPVARMAQIRPREIVNIGNDSHDDLRPFSFGVTINDWSFVAQKLDSDSPPA